MAVGEVLVSSLTNGRLGPDPAPHDAVPVGCETPRVHGEVTGSLFDDLVAELEVLDPTLAGSATQALSELREQVEEQASAAAALLDGHDEGAVLRVPKGRLADLQQCERLAVARHARPDGGPPGVAALRGVALDRFVLLELTQGPIVDPLEELLSVLDVQGELETCDQVVAAASAEPGFADDLAGAAAVWRGVPKSWWPRVQSPAVAQLADGRVVCSGKLDVELGGVLTGHPGVVVEVKSGAPRPAHVEEVALYALLVGWRDGVVPSLVVRWYPDHPAACLPVDAGLLVSAATRLGDAIGQWAQLIVGRRPGETPGPWCRWCPDAAVCPSAAATVEPTRDGAEDPGDEVEWEPPVDEVGP